MPTLIGRVKELDILRLAKQSPTPEFVAIYGRRRVGKTFLVREAFSNQFTFYLTGVANTSTGQQLANFHEAILRYDRKFSGSAPENWFKAFEDLRRLVEGEKGDQKKLIFFDELPWLDNAKSGFLSALEYFWNSFASARKDVLLIVCGSAASWMLTKLIHNRGGLHNRVTRRIRLEPFTLKECEEFFISRNAAFNRYQLIQLYMVMGGIPFYLDQVQRGQSAAQNISRLCFEDGGILRKEFDDLYSSLFRKAEKHEAVIAALSTKAKGLTRLELVSKTKLPNAGSTTRILLELEESGFIRKYPPFGKRERDALYQLTDLYSLFYFKCIRKDAAPGAINWMTGLESPALKAWSGYAFEQVCLAHLGSMKQALGIAGIRTTASSWTGKVNGKGAQIDLLIDRMDQVINLCEMKFSINDFVITRSYFDELRNKIAVFRANTGTRKAIYLTFVTTFGLQQNEYSTALVQNSLTMDALFS